MIVDPLSLTRELVSFPSLTPDNGPCQERLIALLETLGFTIHRLPFENVANFYARLGTGRPHLCFAGHTDVVPPGVTPWSVPPFEGAVRNGLLYGRGVCDMKGGIAAWVAAVSRFLSQRNRFAQQGSLSFLITGDEEGEAVNGTARVLDWMREKNEIPDFCLVGEPTNTVRVGDCIKNGRRGSFSGTLTIQGTQGHIAYPARVDNPIHRAMPLLAKITALQLDEGTEAFEPSSLQFYAIQAGNPRVNNVVPGLLEAGFNIRFNILHTPETLTQRIQSLLDEGRQTGLRATLTTRISGLPFQCAEGPLLHTLSRAIREVTDITPIPSTSGGTSDARFIAQVCPQTLDFGLLGTTIHRTDEHCPVADLAILTEIYQRLLSRLFPEG
ncbi:MAG: succinyl-diaminopimelate desuccinylase [Magnetococcales bacterium]|nr:succinyl-diaminopimelate desuccinylase [Magnetococcales bacterium]